MPTMSSLSCSLLSIGARNTGTSKTRQKHLKKTLFNHLFHHGGCVIIMCIILSDFIDSSASCSYLFTLVALGGGCALVHFLSKSLHFLNIFGQNSLNFLNYLQDYQILFALFKHFCSWQWIAHLFFLLHFCMCFFYLKILQYVDSENLSQIFLFQQIYFSASLVEFVWLWLVQCQKWWSLLHFLSCDLLFCWWCSELGLCPI